MHSESKRVIVIGAGGTIGKAVAERLERAGHQVRRASRGGDIAVDLEDPASIDAMFDAAGEIDAVVSVAGRASFGSVPTADDAVFELSVRSKLMGQVNLVRAAAKRLPASGSVTVTTGILARQPSPGSAAVSMVNAGLEGFVRAAALDLRDGPRVNAVSPPLVKETAIKMGMGPNGVPAALVAEAYQRAVEGTDHGETLHARPGGDARQSRSA